MELFICTGGSTYFSQIRPFKKSSTYMWNSKFNLSNNIFYRMRITRL